MFILKYKSFFLAIAGILVSLSIVSMLSFGLKKSIDFTGGAQIVVVYPQEINVDSQKIKNALTANFGETKITEISKTEYKIVLRDMKEADFAKLKENLFSLSESVTIKEFVMKGPSISSEVTQKAILGFILVVLGIILFITFSFYGIEKPVSSFKYGVITIITLVHDIIIPAGVFAYLGYLKGVEIDSLFIVALLTIFGVSVSDTIVIFDRVRENLKTIKNKSFEEIVGISLNQSFVRSIVTSFCVLIVLVALVIFGPESTKYFAITLTIGTFVGTYSSIFVAAPLLVLTAKYSKNK